MRAFGCVEGCEGQEKDLAEQIRDNGRGLWMERVIVVTSCPILWR